MFVITVIRYKQENYPHIPSFGSKNGTLFCLLLTCIRYSSDRYNRDSDNRDRWLCGAHITAFNRGKQTDFGSVKKVWNFTYN